MTKILVVIPVYGGILQGDDVKASRSEKRARELLAEVDEKLGIVRDHDGCHEHHEHDAQLVGVDLDPLDDAVQVARCPKCGNWEEMSGDESRDKFQSFTWVKDCDVDCTAVYTCDQCGNYVKSEIMEEEKESAPLFLARFTQHDGEYEYDQLAFIRAESQEAAEGMCIEEMKRWWTGNEDEPSMKQDEDNPLCFEEIGVGRVVELDSIREIKSFQEAIDAVGVIDG